jgi:signal transduction histidine kinase
LLEHGELFPGVPTVFCAVDYREVAARDLPANVIGVPIHFDLAASLELALRLHPQTETVAVVTGAAPMDRAWEREARTAFQAYNDRVECRYLTGLALGELIEAVSLLPERSIVYYVHFFQDGLGRTFVPAHVLQTLSERSKVPIYGHVDTYVGRGIVGGRVFSFGAEGRNAARLALRVMAGERPESIGIQGISPNTYLFDARQLKRWQIREADLPPGSDIRFRMPSFWGRYKWQILSVISLCVLQTALIIGLLIHRSHRLKSEEHLRTSQRQLQQLSNSLIDAQETERRRIARELHDDFNQTLALLSVELDLLRQQPPPSADELGRRVRVLSDRVRKLSSSMHELSHELHPLKLEQLGLVAAIRSLCQDVSESHGLAIEFALQRIPDSIPGDVALCLYRIVQEALRNVIKHSGAKAAAVRLDASQEELHLTIADSGIGFHPSGRGGHDGLGLISMRERLRLVGGRLSLQSQPSRGTEVHVHVPLRQRTGERSELHTPLATV